MTIFWITSNFFWQISFGLSLPSSKYKGLTRFVSDNYNEDINDKFSYLTNYAINKNNKNYKKNSDFEKMILIQINGI